MPRRIPSANPYSRDALEFWRSKGIDMEPQIRKLEPHGLSKWAPRIATAAVGGYLGGVAAPALFGSGAAASGAASSAPATGGGFWSGVSAPTFGAAGGATAAASVIPPMVSAPAARFTLGNILKMAEVGVPAITGLFGMRSQNRALDRQAQAEQAALAEEIVFAREQEAQRRAEAERMFVEDQRRWEAEERNRGRELAATEEERAFNRRLLEERESRRAPLRAAAGPALFRLQELMRMRRR